MKQKTTVRQNSVSTPQTETSEETSTKSRFEMRTSSHGDVQSCQLSADNELVWQKSVDRHVDKAAPTYTTNKTVECAMSLLYIQGGVAQKNGATLSHCKYSENSMIELRGN